MFSVFCASLTALFIFAYKGKTYFWPLFISIVFGQVLNLYKMENAVLLSFVVSILLVMSIVDLNTGEIPHLLTIALLLLGITFAGINYGTMAFVTFGVLFLSLFILYTLMNGKGFGAGDLKLYIIFGLFFPMVYYIPFLLINSVCDLAYMGTARFLGWESKEIKYAPILTASFLCTSTLIGIFL